jgi:hypothetical protein
MAPGVEHRRLGQHGITIVQGDGDGGGGGVDR